MKNLMSIMKFEEHLVCVSLITAAYIVAMLFVNAVVVPLQNLLIPGVTSFAALLFPAHGIRVLSAWLFGWKSIPYLICATLAADTLLESQFTAANLELAYTTLLTSSVAWISFQILLIGGIKVEVGERHVSLSTWRLLLLVGFISSLLNSIGHNYILSGELLPEHTFFTLAAFVVGDTTGTVFCFATLMILFRYFRRSDGEA
ncbi:hypothetical protein GN286_16545 [Rhodobacteraceae bacterium IMCC15231]|nr:hypothetical protein [Rhodobacteraceae bacterium IMCC15231]